MITKQQRSVLLVEDDVVDVLTFRRALGELGVHVSLSVASTGDNAIKMLEEGHHLPDIIIMDLNMPRMNGLEVISVLKTHSVWRRIPVLVLTTSNQPHERAQCFDLSVAGYLVKPLSYHEFVQVLSVICAYWNLSDLAV